MLIGTAVAKLNFPDLTIRWDLFLLALVGCVGAQSVSNLINDYVDAKTGLDNPDNFGRLNCIVAGLVTKREVLNMIFAISAISIAIAVVLSLICGPSVALLSSVGLLLSIFYTAPPVRLKYVGLGDLSTLVTFGIGMLFGAYFVQAYAQPDYLDSAKLLKVALYGIPSALLVVAILQANNHRDRENDRQYGARTVANLLPVGASKKYLYFLLLGAYAIMVIAALTGQITYWSLLVLLSGPVLRKLIDRIQRDDYTMTIPGIAQLHGMFGVLTTAGIVMKILTR